ncbi:MAG TPA: serine/threonine-protein kinase [Ktedonobacteraceae bacterium]|nr:serine/threonine-protein kinase [Ktedonobacteraceae bacterium]
MAASPGPGSLLAGHYRILEKIGEGGFGVVYKARDENQRGKLVAIKQINMAALSTQEKIEATDSYNRETTLLPRLRHDSIPRLYDHFTDPDHWYIVLDYVEGRTLDEILATARHGRLPASKVFDIGIKLCDVLGYLHAQKPALIFRDVKPDNIMLTPKGQLYLIDFGIARRYREGQIRDTGPLGSPGYAAPEQYGKAQTTPQSDLYGLGATLQTLLTGKEPLEIRLTGMPEDCNIPPELQALITRLMERDSRDRPRSAEEVKQQLQYLHYHSPQERRRRILTFCGQLVKNSVPQFVIGSSLAVLFGILGLSDGFFASGFLLPCILAMLATVAGRSMLCLHRELDAPGGRSERMEIFWTVWNSLTSSMLMAAVPMLFFYCLYDSLQPLNPFAGPEIVLIAISGVICMIVGLRWTIMCLGWLLKNLPLLIRHLLHGPAWQAAQPRQAAQAPPLQQIHRCP